jgi:DNA-binding NarL/FixJ family response regulator
MIRVLLAEDQAMVRGALAALLSREQDIEVVAEVARGNEVVQAALATQPDVALRRVMAVERVVDPELALSAHSEANNPLTPRERDVLTASLFGASMEEIAARLVLSEGTVRNHLSTAMRDPGRTQSDGSGAAR